MGGDMAKNSEPLRDSLLYCGIISPVLYFVTDIFAGALYPGYNFSSQAVSELFAIGAPTSGWVVPLFTLGSLLTLAFALGVWRRANHSRCLRLIAIMIAGNAVNGLVLWNIFPMHMRGAEATFTDTMHIILAGVGVVFVLGVVLVVALNSKGFLRLFTVMTIFILLVPGAAVFFVIPNMVLGEPTPWVGLTERISTYGYFVWQTYFIINLINSKQNPTKE